MSLKEALFSKRNLTIKKNNKYEFTGESIEHNGHTLYRIRALRKISDICDKDDEGAI